MLKWLNMPNLSSARLLRSSCGESVAPAAGASSDEPATTGRAVPTKAPAVPERKPRRDRPGDVIVELPLLSLTSAGRLAPRWQAAMYQLKGCPRGSDRHRGRSSCSLVAASWFSRGSAGYDGGGRVRPTVVRNQRRVSCPGVRGLSSDAPVVDV